MIDFIMQPWPGWFSGIHFGFTVFSAGGAVRLLIGELLIGFGFISTGILVAGVSMWVIKKLAIKTIRGAAIQYEPKRFHTGVVIGGATFGAGWATTGACPGPIYAQIGGGAWIALFAFAGALAGMFLYAWLKLELPH